MTEALQHEMTIINTTSLSRHRASDEITLGFLLAGSKNRKRLDLLQMRTIRLVTLVHAYRQSFRG